MKEFTYRLISGVLYVGLLLLCLNWEMALRGLLFLFGMICIAEFNKLTGDKSKVPFAIFTLLYGGLMLWDTAFVAGPGYDALIQILHVLTIFVQLFLIKDLFSEKSLPLIITRRYINVTFYLSTAFVFLFLISQFRSNYNPDLLLGCFILVWVSDSFAYLIGKNFGRQKLFPSISPKKTVEGFLGGLLFACIASYILSVFDPKLNFSSWLILAIIISVFGTLGDLIESKYKRQAGVKDSGVIMPGHGGLLDRLDSIIFSAPFVYLFLRILNNVS